MKARRAASAAALCFCALSAPSAKTASLFSKNFTHEMREEIFLDTPTGFSPYPDSRAKLLGSAAVAYNLSSPEMFVDVGARLSSRAADFSLTAVWWPLLWGRFNAGAGVTYHFKKYGGVFFEQDFMPGVHLKYSWGAFTAALYAAFMLKWSRIYAVEDALPRLVNLSAAVGSAWMWTVAGGRFSFYFGFGSCSKYYCPLFLSPNFMTGCLWRFRGPVTAGAEVSFQYIDMLTLSSYCAGVEIRAFLKVKVK